ncbi:hypothetical protein SAMN05443665_1005123 [Actinomadura meyerae]|uniref:Uncharacterized protein n=1 Tax=Actinomadura meyerae TaxID=240840 RepID=A0A239F2H7_9ACTN|nr:hypothetical protein [Actinomadura meyerae]SNS51027.1 hypothetical protein SAMN05443665_1005123 [Actinomadura meyerae]
MPRSVPNPHPSRRAFTLGAAALLGAAAVPSLPGSARAAGPAGWTTQPIPEARPDTTINAIAAPARRSAFAVGVETGTAGRVPVALHWEAGAWRRVPVPAGVVPDLVDVAARTPGRAWAIAQSSVWTDDPLMMRWRGGAWEAVEAPIGEWVALDLDQYGRPWMIGGEVDDHLGPITSVYRRDRTGWTRLLYEPIQTVFTALSVRTASDMWLGGYGTLRHFDGQTWTDRTIPDPSGYGHWVLQIEQVSSGEAWFLTVRTHPLDMTARLVHWDGTGFTVHSLPGPSSAVGTMSAVGFLGSLATDGRGGVWVGDGMYRTLRHFDGTTWTVADVPMQGANQIQALVRVPHSRMVWAGGRLPHTLRFA